MSRYRFWRDPLWWMACLAYAANRWIGVPLFDGKWFRGHFNDFWLIPAALPLVLELESLAQLRTSGTAPSGLEVLFHWLVWSIVCEGIAPLFLSQSVADWADVAAYGAGAILGFIWWRRKTITA